MKKQYLIYALLLAYSCSAFAVKPMPQHKPVHQNVQAAETSVDDEGNENNEGTEEAPKKPTILDSWRKVATLNLRSLNRDDAWNFGKTFTFVGVGYFLYSYLPKGPNGSNAGLNNPNNPNNPGGPNGPNNPNGPNGPGGPGGPNDPNNDGDFDIDNPFGGDLEQQRQQEEAFARYERENRIARERQVQEERRQAIDRAERDRIATQLAQERVERDRIAQEIRQQQAEHRRQAAERQAEAQRQIEERNRLAQIERDRLAAERARQLQAQQAEYEEGMRWARAERERLIAERERERVQPEERHQQYRDDVAHRRERQLPFRHYYEWVAGQESQEVRERQEQADRDLLAERAARTERERLAQEERERLAQEERERQAAERAEQLRQLQEQAERARVARVEEAQRQAERDRLAREESTRQQEEMRRLRENYQRHLAEHADRARQLQQQEADELAEAIRQSQQMEDERVRNASVSPVNNSNASVTTVNNPEAEVPALQTVVEQAQQRECDICAEERNVNEYSEMPCCQFSLCTTCLGEHLTACVDKNATAEVTCPNRNCHDEKNNPKKIEHHVMRALTVNNRDLFERYLNIEMNEGLREIPGVRQCRTPNCNFMYFPYDENRPGSIVCGRCNERYCSHCGFPHAANMTCAQAERERDPNLAEQANQEWIAQNTKPCPNCNHAIQKNAGCNHMTCGQCRHQFCWTCLATYRTTRCNSAECETMGINTGYNF